MLVLACKVCNGFMRMNRCRSGKEEAALANDVMKFVS